MKSRLPIARLVLGTVAGIGISLTLVHPSRAGEPVGANPLQDLNPLDRNNSDPFSRTNSDGASSVFNLIHRLTLGNNRSTEDFSSEQNENLTDAVAQFRAKQQSRLQGQTPGQAPARNNNLSTAASEFRAKQRSLLQGQPPATPVTPVITP